MKIGRFLLTIVLGAILAVSGRFLCFATPQAPLMGAQRDHSDAGKQPGVRKGEESVDLDDLDSSQSELRRVIERYGIDLGSLNRSYPVAISPGRRARLKRFYTEWRERLAKLDFDAMSLDGRIDYLLFKNHLEYELSQLEIQAGQFVETEPLIPFAKAIIELEEARRRMEPINSPKAAELLAEMKKQIDETRERVSTGIKPEGKAGGKDDSEADTKAGGKAESRPGKVKKTTANRAVATINSLRNTLKNWFGFYNGYDPIFTWWMEEPYKAVDQALGSYAAFLSEKLAGTRIAQHGGEVSASPRDSADIIGDPIGREALLVELAHEMIPYTPEELIAIANKEFEWCENEMKKASRELGYGDDWRKALEYVKTLYVEPGKQPELIRQLAVEAIDFLDIHDLVTVPQLARESWRMEMMTPERQLVNPFFTGGETISVSYPTNAMSHEQKMMSMRGNNIHFARATVFHELIPGHQLQGFMTARYKPYRGLFSTPFWGEGWALYWELLLWDLNFAKTPENRIGMLFWRMHRCARIVFSLSFHLEQMTPQQCIDLLVKRVGHELDNATAEVRRSFAGSYGPLYQAAYLLGGMQLYALHKELVDSGKMTNRAFHDAILKENRIPVEMVRAILTRQNPTRDFKSNWKFYGPNPGR